MNKIIFYIPLLFAASILLVHLIPAEATPPCMMGEPVDVWISYDDIYTGKVVSISNQTEYIKNDPELSEWQKSADVRINFELERLLKGNPQTSWHYAVPLESYCPGDFCVSGSDHFLIGTEIFYIDNFNGNGYSFDGACGIGYITDQSRTAKELLGYFEDIYGFSVPKSPHSLGEKTTCNNNEHVLVLRDNNKRACVTEKTSHKMNWNEITNEGIQFQNNTNVDVTYDYPLSSKTTQIKNGYSSSHYQFDSEVTLSKLPKIGETAEIIMTYTNLEEDSQPYEEDIVQFIISSNFRFVDIDYEDISSFHPRYGIYSEEFQSIKQNHENTFSVTIKAVAEGHGSIGVGGRGSQHQFIVHVDKDQTLLVEDYFRNYYPVTNTNLYDNNNDKIIETLRESTETEGISRVSCKDMILANSGSISYGIDPNDPCDETKTFEYGYKIVHENNTEKTKDYEIIETGELKQTIEALTDKKKQDLLTNINNKERFILDKSGQPSLADKIKNYKESIQRSTQELERLGALDNIMDSYEIKLSKLPTLYEAGEIEVSFTTTKEDYSKLDFVRSPHMFIEISDNLDFVGIPEKEIKQTGYSTWSKKQFAYGHPFFTSFHLESDQKHTLFATIEASRLGSANISIYVGDISDFIYDDNRRTKTFQIVIGEDETLLIDDYFKKHLSDVETFSEMK